MKSGRTIDISKSSLISLKAELTRKQEEVQKAKTEDGYIKLPPKAKKEPKANPGVQERNATDLEQLDDTEIDKLKKSRDVLELKTKLYEKLQSGTLVQEKGGTEYLVDFKQKALESTNEKQETDHVPSDEEGHKSDYHNSASDSDSEWIDYTDCLGRTRRCLKEDLSSVKLRDEKLAASLYGKKTENEKSIDSEERGPGPSCDPDQAELMSNDMYKEQLRQKWEQQEREILNKKNLYYEDIRFDEARTHGVSYFKFSTEESEREKEQEMLREVRRETERRQKEASSLRERRERQKQARLIAARQRQRARLGLPPIDVSEIESKVEVKEPEPDEKKEPEEEETHERLEAALKKAARVRPWDIGKDGVQQKPVMTQEEWVNKKRDERPDEFAPFYAKEPESRGYQREYQSEGQVPKKKKFFQKNRPEPAEYPQTDFEPSHQPGSSSAPQGKKGAEIPPPTSFDYYTPHHKTSQSNRTTANNAEQAIEAGLNFLRQQMEKKSNKKREFPDML